MIRNRFFLLFFVIFFSLNLYASNVIGVSSSDEDISLLENSEVFIDKTAKLDYVKVSQMPNSFQASQTNFISRGYTTNEAVWVRFTLHNDANETLQRVLHVDNSMFDEINFYENTKHHVTKGVLNRPPFNGIIDFYFHITLQPEETHTYYVRLFSNSSATYFHLYLETKDKLWQKSLNRELLLSAFFSLLFALIIYNFFIFIFTLDKVYLFYSLFLLAITNNHLSYTSMTLPVLHMLLSDKGIETFSKIDAYFGIYYFAVIIFSLLFFAREFMKLYRYKILDIMFKIQILVYVVLTLLSEHYYYLLDLSVYFSFVSLFFLISCAAYLLYKREENAIYIFFGFGINLIGHFFWLLFNLGVYTPVHGYWYFYELSVATEVLLFSVILSKKLNHIKALAQALSTQKVLIRELHHRVKNNLQFIISFYRIKLRKHLNADGKEKLEEAEQSIRSIGKIHEILYTQNDLSTINTALYFKELLKEVQQGYPLKSVAFRVQSDVLLETDAAIYCGIIINELVTNAFKYAFKDNKGEISIRLHVHNKEKMLFIADNGIGFDYEKRNESFGLSFIEDLVYRELKGTIEFENKHGSHYTIKWS